MKRRGFINLAAMSALTVPFITRCSKTISLPDSSHLVETPGKRAEYLAKILKLICTDLGPHPVGSPECEKAMHIIKNEMHLALPIVELDTFLFDRWMLSDKPRFSIGDTVIEAFPRIETAGTPLNGITGAVVKLKTKGLPSYGIADRSSGNVMAYISPYNGTARPTLARGDEMRHKPTVNIGKQDVQLIEAAIQHKTPAQLFVPVTIISDTETSNIVGTLPGKSTDDILFLAHYDTVYSTPGANDNTASVAIMLMLAHELSGTIPEKTIRFVATTSEERGDYMGATKYAERRKREDTMNNIKYVINFDSGTWGSNIEIWSEDEELKKMISDIDRDLGVNGTPILMDRSGFTMDSKPFRESGARAVYVESNSPDKVYLWHRPIDTPGNVQEFMVEINFLLFSEYIKRLQKL